MARTGDGSRSDLPAMAPILVVDDDAKIVNLIRAYLEREGFRVVTAGDGTKALQAVWEHRPRLIVLDLMLPELDGLAVLRCVREASDVPVLVLSARGSAADRVRGIHEGADDYLAKRFSPAELVVRAALDIPSDLAEIEDIRQVLVRRDDGSRKQLGEAGSIVLARRPRLPVVLDDQDAANYARSSEHLTVFRSLNLLLGVLEANELSCPAGWETISE